MEFNNQILSLQRYIRELEGNIKVPIQGYISQVGAPKSFHFDGWVGPEFKTTIRAQRPIKGFVIRASIPDFFRSVNQITISCNGKALAALDVSPGNTIEQQIDLDLPRGEQFTIEINSSAFFNCKENGINDDTRNLAMLLQSWEFQHEA